MATEKQQRFYQLPNGMWVDAMTGQRSPSIVNLKEALIEAASPKAQARASRVEEERPEEYEAWLYDPTNISLPKPSDYSTLINTFNESAKILGNPSDSIGFLPKEGKVGSFINFLETLSPTTYVGRGMLEGSKGNYRGSAQNFGTAFASIFPGTKVGREVASRFFPKILGRVAGDTRKVVPFIKQTVQRSSSGLPFAASQALPTSTKPSTPVYPYPARPASPATREVMTADQMERRAAAERNRTDAQGRSGMGATSTVYTDGVRPPGGVPGARPELNVGPPVPVSPSAPIARVPMPALSPLSPEELGQYGEDLTAIDKLYKQTLADIAQDEEQGQLGYARVGQAAQRRAAGAAVDIGNQMAGSGIGSSPAAAFGAEQMVQAPLVQQRQANRLNLDQLLAQLQKQRTQAGTAMDMSKVGLNRWMTQQRAANTRSQIESGYRNSLGGM